MRKTSNLITNNKNLTIYPRETADMDGPDIGENTEMIFLPGKVYRIPYDSTNCIRFYGFNLSSGERLISG